jgi:hypothetical protein
MEIPGVTPDQAGRLRHPNIVPLRIGSATATTLTKDRSRE